MIPFTHLHVHSQYSLLDGQAPVTALVDKALADNMPGLAITDHGNMFGVKEIYNYVNGGALKGFKKKLEKAQKTGDTGKAEQIQGWIDRLKNGDFKLILGCEMYVANKSLHEQTDKRDTGRHLVVLAKNKTGYKNLIKLVSKAWTEGFYQHPRTDKAELAAHKEGLIVSSACLGGEIPRLIRQGQIEEAEKQVKWWKDTFGDDYYLELQRHKTNVPGGNRDTYEAQEQVNPELIRIARKLGVKIICTNDSHFVNAEDAEAHDRLICISTNSNLNDPARMRYTKQEWLKTQQEMYDIFSDIPEALENTNEIVAKVEHYTIDHGPIMPNFEIPADFGSEEEYRSRITEEDLFNEFTCDENGNVVLSHEEAEAKIKKLGGYDKLYRIKFEADYLAKLAYEGAHKRYGENLNEELLERIKFELHIMKTMGFPGYFLIVQDFIKAAREQLGVSVGPGRGSAAGSCVAYCLGITQIDPVKYDLLFERFLNPDRISLPDIDIDFDDDGRADVLHYVTQKYGEEKVAHIITYGTMAAKSAIKDVARIEQLPLSESDRLTKLIPRRMPTVEGKELKPTLDNCYNYVPEFKPELASQNELIVETLKFAKALEGTVRNTGVHACGVIICRDDITDWVPVSTAVDKASDSKEKIIVTQYEGRVIEETGLIKMDFLGLKTLSIIKEAVANIKRTRGIDIDMDNIPIDDPATYKLYCEGRTTGTFQFESPGMQKYLRGLQPSKFEDLIAMNALYRPGPMDYIPQFINRKHGKEPIVYDIPIMEKYLAETYGITVYQEQVMLLSRLLANFTRGESDMLRKAMGKKQIDKMAKLKVKFMSEGVKNGHDAQVLEKIWADWEKFASYAFNKSHATCYSWVSYQTGYLKANYPAEYMAGVLSRNLGSPDKMSKFIDECKSMKIPVKGPDINESVESFGVNKSGEIRFGLGGIKGLGVNAIGAIISERDENGPYKDIYDLVERVNLSACNKSAIENLALSGCFDSFGDFEREAIVAEADGVSFSDVLVKYGQRFQADKNSLQGSLFDDIETIATSRPSMPVVKDKWTDIKRLEEEKKLVTMYLSSHPLDPFYMELTYGTTVTCEKVSSLKGDGLTVFFGGLVTSSETKTSQKGTAFGIVTIEDFAGSTEIRLFGKNFMQFKDMALPGTSVMVKAMITRNRLRPDYSDLRVMDMRYLSDLSGSVANAVTIDLMAEENPDDINALLEEARSRVSDETRNGVVQLKVYSPESRQAVTLRSRHKFPLDKSFLSSLDDREIHYRVHTLKD